MQDTSTELSGLNKEQERAVKNLEGQLLVVAGAGTGKTRVIVERIQNLMAKGVSPSRILALTFTEKAAAEMLDRVNAARGIVNAELPIMTFNAFGESLLRQYAADIGLGRNFTVMGDNAQIVFLRERIDELQLDYFAPISRPDSLLGDIANYFSQLKQYVVNPADYHTYVKSLPSNDAAAKQELQKQKELATAYEVYIRLCKQANVIDYDDQIYMVIEMFQRRPNVLAAVRDSFDYVMVDEFQDTNLMQSQLIDLIANGSKNLCVVGDDDQSIYGWRGATLANILSFKERYPKSKQITLVHNYRSTREILKKSYQLITNNNPHRLEHKLNINKQLVSDRKGVEPAAYRFSSLSEELHWIAEDVKRRLASGTPPGDIAILARRNATLEQLHDYLEYSGVNHVMIGQRHDLYQAPAVRALLEALRAIVDPHDNVSLYHTLTGPLLSVPVSSLSELASVVRRQHGQLGTTINEALGSQHEGARAALQQIQAWRDKSALITVGQLAYDVLSSSGYTSRLAQAAEAGEAEAAVAITRISELFQTFKEFERIALQPSTVQYVEALPALQAAGDINEDSTLDLSADNVNLLSVHKSKGLEWPVVYIADCTEGSFPVRESKRGITVPRDLLKISTEADEHIHEERRLMYVAMTRAKDELVLTYADKHFSTPRKPSRFLAEIYSTTEPQVESVATQTPLIDLKKFQDVETSGMSLPANILKGGTVTLTVSQAIKYLECPLDFYYGHVLRVPTQPHPSLEYGSLMHKFLQDMHKGRLENKPLSLEELLMRFEQECPKSGYLSLKQQQRAMEQGRKTLERLHHQLQTDERQPLAVEEPFEVELKNCKLVLKGRFDAIFPLENGVEIVDYKTSSSVTTPEKAKQKATSNQQLTLYALAWQELHDELPVKVTLDFIDTGMKGSVRKTKRGIDTMVEKLAGAADGVRAQDFRPGKNHLFCQHPPL